MAQLKPEVRVGPARAEPELVTQLSRFGVATLHEAMGRQGLLGHHLLPLWPGAQAAGTAVTALCAPGDNLMVHVAMEQLHPGDLLLVTTWEPSEEGFLGELLITSLRARGAVALVTTTGVRDVAEINRIGFPVWSRAVSAQGTAKATAGSVNRPVEIEGTTVSPGDIILGDDDGVVCVPRERAVETLELARKRVEREDEMREKLARGELGLDLYGMRPLLQRLGVDYLPWQADEGDG